MKIKSTTQFALLATIGLLIISVLLVIHRNETIEWKEYQKEYIQKAIGKTDDPRIKKILQSKQAGINQIIVRDFGDERVDRCMTCHASIDDERFKNEPHPFKSHPDIIKHHPQSKFGCTLCHDGNGRGLTAYDAHGEDHYWIRTMLTGKMVESACAKCHGFPFLESTPKLRAGFDLFFKNACNLCHKVEGVSNGKLGIELTEAGSKWDIEYLKESIVDPKANNPESLMPELKLSETEVEDLLIYLRSLTGENLVIGPVLSHQKLKAWKNKKRPEVEVSIESGKKVFNTFGCAGCHRVNGEGKLVGSELTYVGLQRSREWIIQHFVDPRSLVAGSLMPDIVFSKTEMEAITMYLMSLKGPGTESDQTVDAPKENEEKNEK